MMKIFLSLLVALCVSANFYAQPRVLLAGDYPDPTIVRDGKDYYMTHSPFYYQPGFLIWHSTDLQTWKPIKRALTQWKGSAMAPDLIKHNGKFYLYYPSAGTNWVSVADRIDGEWSEPIDLKISGIDPGHLATPDSKRYLFTNEGKVTPLAPDGLSKAGETTKIYDGWVYPKEWKTEAGGMWLESPKLTYKDGYYYMTSAEGGTAGPATSHMAVVARSKSPTGPYENSPNNPLIHTYSETDNWWSKGHGTLIDDVDGNWYIVYHAYAKDYHTLGRQTLIEPIKWTTDGWLLTDKWHSREWKTTTIDNNQPLMWTFWKEYAPEAITINGDAWTIKGKGSTPADGRLYMTTANDKSYNIETELTLGKNNTAGLLLYYNERAFAGVVNNGKKFTIYRDGEAAPVVIPHKMGRHCFLQIRNKGNHCTFLARPNEQTEWQTLIEDIDVSSLHHNNYKGFFALRPTLVSMGKGEATFRNVKYANAVPTEKDMAAYLMVYFTDPTHSLFMAVSDDGYTFTDVNNAQPVMAGDTISLQKGIRDPYIFRGPDGAFYLAMTDLHIFSNRIGRATRWERGEEYGWGNNRALVLMKSYDLLNWKRTNVRFDQMSPSLADVGCVWAPEIAYDKEREKLMIYFTMRYRNGQNKLYYVYVNEAFDTVETLPQLLFEHPDGKTTTIDGDITPMPNGEYMLTYVAHETPGGIKMSFSDRINGGYSYIHRQIDFESGACEAPNVWKRIGEDKWVLMYDIFSINPHNFGFAETSDFSTFTDLGRFNQAPKGASEPIMKTTNFTSPKHGAVIHITREEADRLRKHWAQ